MGNKAPSAGPTAGAAPKGARLARAAIPPSVCRFYLQGTCRSENAGTPCKYQHPPPTPSRSANLRRIDHLAASVDEFFKIVFASGSSGDRCTLVKFSDHADIMGTALNTDGALLSRALWSLPVNQPYHGHSTKLWDVIISAVQPFAKAADQARPWLLVILTDGADVDSSHTPAEVVRLLKAFNAPANNVCLFVGIGDVGSKIKAICDETGSLYVPVASAEALRVVFALLALQVTQGVRIHAADIQTADARMVIVQAQRVASLSRNPVDILLLCDVSGSMYQH